MFWIRLFVVLGVAGSAGQVLAQCLEPNDPPENAFGTAGLNYSCHDPRDVGATPAALPDFVAFHTRLPATDLARDPRDEGTHPISGGFADVVVNLPGLGRLEFGRVTSYQPVWYASFTTPTTLPTLVTRTGDSVDPNRPDRLNRYSYARILQNGPSEIVVHWRYAADHCDPTPSGIVHELFTIRPDGTVTRRVHVGAPGLDTANSSSNNLRQELTLTTSGVTAPAAINETRAFTPAGGPPSAVDAHPVANPRLDFRMDDDGGSLRVAEESVGTPEGAIQGRYPTWYPGVSGSALSFDGYTTDVGYPAANATPPAGSFTVEAWVSLAAYPFGTVQIAGQASPNGNNSYSPDTVEGGLLGVYNMVDANNVPIAGPITVGGTGYLLAIDALGQTNFMANFGGTWTTALDETRLPLHTWNHIVGVYDAAVPELRVYVNGTEFADAPTTGSLTAAASQDFVIGRNREPQWIVAGSEMHEEVFNNAIFGFEGLIDEVRLYDRALTGAEITSAATRTASATAPSLPPRDLPVIAPSSTFSADYQTIPHHPDWDYLAHETGGFDDVVVTYQSLPTSVMFWKAMSYAPTWISENGLWTHDQSMEWGDSHGLAEHMSDKQQRYAHVRILEDTPARKVIHWRYAVVSTHYRLVAPAGDLAWVDEYFTMYPDGTTVRFVDDWFCSQEGGVNMGFQGTYFGTGPTDRWQDVVNDPVATVFNEAGTSGDLSLVSATPPANELADAIMIVTNTKSTQRLFRGISTGSGITYYPGLATVWDGFSIVDDPNSATTPFSFGNHFPVAVIPNDGRTAIWHDRIGHSEGFIDVFAANKTMLYGFSETADPNAPPTDQGDAIDLIIGWNNPPTATVTNGTLTSLGYEQRDHAYHFSGTDNALEFTLSGGDVIRNPGVVVRGWTGGSSPTLTINGSPTAVSTGVTYNGGVRSLVVGLPVNTNNATIGIVDSGSPVPVLGAIWRWVLASLGLLGVIALRRTRATRS